MFSHLFALTLHPWVCRYSLLPCLLMAQGFLKCTGASQNFVVHPIEVTQSASSHVAFPSILVCQPGLQIRDGETRIIMG